MKNTNRFLPVVLLLTLALLSGCENRRNGENTETGASVPNGSGGSATAEKTSNDAKLDEIVKKALVKGPLSELPLELTGLSVNWTDKSVASASGTFSAKTKTTEGLFKPVESKDGLKRLKITELYEGEVKAAEEKVWNLPEPYKTNLGNAVPKDRLERFRFVETLVPTGGEVTLTGRVELAKYGDDWQVEQIQGRSISCGDGFVPESGLWEAYRLEDPKTREAVEAVIRERKDFVDGVDSTIAELESKRQAALKKQKDEFDTYCKPGMKYEGSFRMGSKSGAVRIVFEDYATPDKNTVDGTISYLGYTNIKWKFTVTVNTREVTAYPVVGRVIRPRNDSIHYILKDDHGLTGRESDYELLADMLHGKDKIAIRFADGMIFTVNGYDVGYADADRIVFDLAK